MKPSAEELRDFVRRIIVMLGVGVLLLVCILSCNEDIRKRTEHAWFHRVEAPVYEEQQTLVDFAITEATQAEETWKLEAAMTGEGQAASGLREAGLEKMSVLDVPNYREFNVGGKLVFDGAVGWALSKVDGKERDRIVVAVSGRLRDGETRTSVSFPSYEAAEEQYTRLLGIWERPDLRAHLAGLTDWLTTSTTGRAVTILGLVWIASFIAVVWGFKRRTKQPATGEK